MAVVFSTGDRIVQELGGTPGPLNRYQSITVR